MTNEPQTTSAGRLFHPLNIENRITETFKNYIVTRFFTKKLVNGLVILCVSLNEYQQNMIVSSPLHENWDELFASFSGKRVPRRRIKRSIPLNIL